MCKRKVIPGDPDDSDSESESEDEAPSENTPLLHGGNNNNAPRSSTFDNSGEDLWNQTGVEIVGKFCISNGIVLKRSTCPPLFLPSPTVPDNIWTR